MGYIVFFFYKLLHLLVPVHDHGKGRGLHPAHFQVLVIKDGKKTARIDPHQPVCFCPA